MIRISVLKTWNIYPALLLLISSTLISSCANLPFKKVNKAYSRIFETEYSTAWAAAVESVSKGAEINQNRDLGTIETGWIDNTERHNFFEAFAPEDFYLHSRYKIFIYVKAGKKYGKDAVVVRVQKLQQVEKSIYSGWQKIDSNGVDEATYLYRIGRIIALQEYADKQEEVRSRDLQITF